MIHISNYLVFPTFGKSQYIFAYVVVWHKHGKSFHSYHKEHALEVDALFQDVF